MYVKLYSAHLIGIEGQVIDVEVDTSFGLPHFDIVGLPGTALKESKERVRSAIKNSGYTFPSKRITVNLAPAHIRKEGSTFDLAIALAILIADEQVKLSQDQLKKLTDMLFIGELALDGSIRKGYGIFPLVLSAKTNFFSKVFLPCDNMPESTSVKGIDSIPIRHLSQLIQCISSSSDMQTKTIESLRESYLDANPSQNERFPSRQQEVFEDIKGQEHVKRAFEVAACGFHHVLMIGPPGSGKTMLSKCFSQLLPELSDEEAIEVTKIHSVAGLLEKEEGLVRRRPFRSPHHTITSAGMLGGGTPIKPGEISNAHQGVLFLDEFLEFKKPVMEGLREPLEERHITITRSHHQYTFPSHCLLIVAMNPCPCGFYGYETEQRKCTCHATQIDKYQHKLSGPLYDRLDIHIDVPLIGFEDLMANNKSNPDFTTANMKRKIAAGLEFKKYRNGGDNANGMLNPKEIKEQCTLTKEAEELLRLAFDELHFSARGYHKILKVARTIADLNQTERIDEVAIAEAIHYRSLDRRR
jgi:magnesium chelatase family protein